MKAVILAGGLGTRLKPFTEVIPKPLLPIGEKAVLEIQIERLKKHNFDEIFLATNYKSSYIQNFLGDGSRYGVKLIISKEDKPLGTAGPLTLIKKHFSEPFLVMNGDILTLLDFTKLYQFAMAKKNALTISIKQIIVPYDFGNIYFEGDLVKGIGAKSDIITYALAGVYIMTPEVFNYIPDNTYYGVDLLIKDLLANKQDILKYEIEEYWLDVGKIDDYNKTNDIYNKHFKVD